MPRSMMNVKQVAASLHVSPREVVRMAEQRVLAGVKVRGVWQFRAGEVWNWVEENLHALPKHRRRDRHPETPGHMLVTGAMKEHGVAVDLVAKTKASVLRELAELAAAVDPYVDAGVLVEDLIERERQGSTALQDGVAIPHPARPCYSEGPIVVAARTCQGIVFGERRGGLTDLLFLVCCPEQADHLLYLGRLCRLLIDKNLQASLRSVESAAEFLDALHAAESALCQSA
jgi:mannitol/fructose-specific phosphotransferase system IIA component (Ntr-type)